MAINIQNIVDALQAKINAADSDLSTTELGRLAAANRILGELQNAVGYKSTNVIPEASQYNQGRILWDSETGNYITSALFQWNNIELGSALNQIDQFGTETSVQNGGMSVVPIPVNVLSTVDTFPFAADTTPAVALQSLTTASYQTQGHSSETHSFVASGIGGAGQSLAATVDVQPFSSGSPMSNLSGLNGDRHQGQSNHNINSGKAYISGGIVFPGGAGFGTDAIDKYDMVTSGSVNGTNVSNLVGGDRRTNATAFQSKEDAYQYGGYTSPPLVQSTSAEKFPFANETSSALAPGVDLTAANVNSSGANYGKTAGYILVGAAASIYTVPFASETSTLNTPTTPLTGQNNKPGANTSSATTGYTMGGVPNPSTVTAQRYRFPYASVVPIASISGNMTVQRGWGVGTQT